MRLEDYFTCKRSGGAAEWTAHQMINDVLMAHLQK